MRSKLLNVSIVLLAVLTVSGACSSSSDEAIVVYSGRTEELIQPILDDFTEETGIAVEPRFENSDDLALLIETEGSDTPADVFLSQSPGAVGFLEGEGMLAELSSDVLDLVPETVRDAKGRWVGFSGRQRVMVYNPDMVSADELPDSIYDLTAPEWSGRVAIAPGNGSFQDFVSLMRAQVGDDTTSQFLEGLAANDVQTFDGNSAIVAAVGRGEVAAGLVNHYYNYRATDEDPNHNGLNHQFAIDDPGSVLIVTGAAILDASDNKDSAQMLVEYLLSESAQRYFADETFEYPLGNGLEPSGEIPPASFSSVSAVDFNSLGGSLAGTRDLIQAAGLDG